jgi:hypothetical protein
MSESPPIVVEVLGPHAARALGKRYLDASAQDFSVETQALLKEEREIYDMLRAQKVRC